MNGLRKLLSISIVFFVLIGAGMSRAQEEKDWRFGVIEAYTARNAARELEVGWTRVSFHWAEAQANGPESWTPAVSDEQIEEQISEGREIIGLLIGIPDWARDEDDLPAGLWLDHDDPHNLWASFVRQVAGRYAGRIDDWIIWNEPDIDETEVAHSWDGSVDDFYQLQRVAYLAAKEANPGAVLHLAAFTYWADVSAGREQYMARLLDRILADPLAAEHNFYFDVATAHLYFQPDQIYDLLGIFQEIMRDRGLAQPIWLVETNAPPHDDPGWPVPDPTLSVTETEQAAFMPQALAAALAAGAERIGVYKLRDTEEDQAANPEPFGLLRRDGSRRVAYTTYREAIRAMRGTTNATRERWDEIAQFRLEQPDRITTVLFARLPDPQQVTVEAISDTARLVDMWGQEEWLEAEDGRYVIDLQQALCTQTIGDYCMIGGTVLYLIQGRDGGPPSRETLSPLLTPTATPLLPTVTASPTSTEMPAPSPSATSTSPPLVTETSNPPPATPTAASQAVTLQMERTSEPAAIVSPSPSAAVPAGQNPARVSSIIPFVAAASLAVVLVLYWGISRWGRP